MSEFTHTEDNLFAGDFPVATDEVIIKSGQGVLPRGTVLGELTADGKEVILDPAASTGAEKPYAVLAETVDATSADKSAPAYLTGQFNLGALGISGDVFSVGTLKAMKDVSLFTRPVGERS